MSRNAFKERDRPGFKRSLKCSKKRRFRDHAEAVKCMQRVQSRSNRETVPIRVYACHQCEGYHITSKEFLER